jgi:hypothetical protein
MNHVFEKKKQTFWFETLMIDVLYFTVILSEYVKLNFVMIVTTLCIPLTTGYSGLSECLPAVTKTHCTMWVRNSIIPTLPHLLFNQFDFADVCFMSTATAKITFLCQPYVVYTSVCNTVSHLTQKK